MYYVLTIASEDIDMYEYELLPLDYYVPERERESDDMITAISISLIWAFEYTMVEITEY